MRIVSSLFMFIAFFLTACGPAPEMPEYKSASVDLLNKNDQKNFYLLPLKGSARTPDKLWSGSFWRSNRGLINYRWHTLFPEGFDYLSPSHDEAFSMTTGSVASLSPSEKFDLLMGRYDYPLKEMVAEKANRNALNWENLSNGTTLATFNHKEPGPKTLTNPDGIVIPFATSDIKALLAFYYGHIHDPVVLEHMGKDKVLNAGAFHVILSNKTGLKGKSFLVDVDRGKEEWNFPVVHYTSHVLKEYPAKIDSPAGTVKILEIGTRIFFVGEARNLTWHPLLGTDDQILMPKEYSYHLFLDLNNDIIGGEWISEERPHYIWTTVPATGFIDLFDGLQQLLND